MNLNNNMLELESRNKNYVYNKLYINSIKFIYNQIKLHNTNDKYKDCLYLLYKTSKERYDIECILNKLFPYLGLDFNLEKFGRSRSNFDPHGRKYIKKKYDKKNYIPFNFLLNDDYEEPLITPINIKYSSYKEKIKQICNNKYDINKLYISEPLIKLLYTCDPTCHTIIYKDIELTSFYYENNDNLYSELKSINVYNRLLSTDMNMYRAIYHTNPKNHKYILNIINKKYKKILKNVNSINYNDELYIENIKLIKKIYWYLSHATLYDRGSCAITEIFCNALLLFISIDKDYIYFKNKIDLESQLYYNTDIEAMLISNPSIFVKNFDSYVDYIKLPNEEYINLDVNNIIYGINNNNYKRIYDYDNIENINILEYLSNFSSNTEKSDNKPLNDLLNEFKIENSI